MVIEVSFFPSYSQCSRSGSGKTTLAGKLVGRLNRDLETPCAILVGMDGWWVLLQTKVEVY